MGTTSLRNEGGFAWAAEALARQTTSHPRVKAVRNTSQPRVAGRNPVAGIEEESLDLFGQLYVAYLLAAPDATTNPV